jgi:hypothetical protein
MVKTASGEPVMVNRPKSANLPGHKARKMVECTACEKVRGQYPRFPLAAIMANHFKKSHPDLYKSRDSWRDYATYVEVELDGNNGR